MLFNADVLILSRMYLCFSGQYTLLYCKLTPCNFLFLMCEKDTVHPLFAFLPVNMHLRPDLPWMPGELERRKVS